MQGTVRLKARTSQGEVTTTELVTFSRPAVVSTLAEVGLVLSETKARRGSKRAVYGLHRKWPEARQPRDSTFRV
jgi:hypothetical protein